MRIGRGLAALVLIGLAGAAPSCSTETCANGQALVCLQDNSECTCPDPCNNFDDCKPQGGVARFCYTKLSACLPAEYFTGTCSDGTPCTGGTCISNTGRCAPLCTHSSECPSRCCVYTPTQGVAPNPYCEESATGHTCIP